MSKTCCSVNGCSRPAGARGLCYPHYSTWHRAQRKYRITCPLCGETVQMQYKAKYCSRTCAAHAAASAGGVALGAIRSAEALERRKKKYLPVVYEGPKLSMFEARLIRIHKRRKRRLRILQSRAGKSF